MDLVCLDLEGVLVPEIWIEFSESTGIEELRWLGDRYIKVYLRLLLGAPIRVWVACALAQHRYMFFFHISGARNVHAPVFR